MTDPTPLAPGVWGVADENGRRLRIDMPALLAARGYPDTFENRDRLKVALLTHALIANQTIEEAEPPPVERETVERRLAAERSCLAVYTALGSTAPRAILAAERITALEAELAKLNEPSG